MALDPLDPRKWEAVEFPEHPQHDTIWSITLGHDDQVYLGLCLEGKGGGVAQVYRYDTNARQLQHLADMGEVTGEAADSGHATQGKIHFSLCHATDGKLYGATHCTTPPMGQRIWSPLTMWGDPVMSFPGGHIFRYDTHTGESVDFGPIFPNDGIPYLTLDEERERLYGVTYPKAHFFRTDLVGRNVVDYGRVSSWYPISMVFDETGNLWHTCSRSIPNSGDSPTSAYSAPRSRTTGSPTPLARRASAPSERSSSARPTASPICSSTIRPFPVVEGPAEPHGSARREIPISRTEDCHDPAHQTQFYGSCLR